MIEISHFTASWLIPLLWYILFAVIMSWFCRPELEIGVIPGCMIFIIGTIVYAIYVIKWCCIHWNEFHILPHFFKIVN